MPARNKGFMVEIVSSILPAQSQGLNFYVTHRPLSKLPGADTSRLGTIDCGHAVLSPLGTLSMIETPPFALSGMTVDFTIGDYAAAWMPSVFIPLVLIGAFVAMGILFTVVESTD